MTKRSPDAVDRLILRQLSLNARTTLSAIARDVGLSRAAVHQRVSRLERDDIIAGYTTRLHPVARRVQVSAVVMLNIEATRWAEIASELQGWPEVRACWSMAGDKDMAVLVDVSSNEDLMGLTERLNAMRTVRNTATHVVLRTHFDRGVAPP